MKKRRLPLMLVAVYLSFCCMNWFYYRGILTLIQMNLPDILRDIAAFFIAGFLPALCFEIAINMFDFRLTRARITSPQMAQEFLNSRKKINNVFRIFLICGNIAAFLIGLIYFKHRIFFTYGKILLGFSTTLISLIAYNIFSFIRGERSEFGTTVMNSTRVFITAYAMITAIELALMLTA